MSLKTPLHDLHQTMGARMVPFAGWDMPLHYGSQVEEHHQVRKDAGMFDVSHMLAIDILGEHGQAFLRYLLANDAAQLREAGKALYSCMLNDHGGVLDDMIVYCLTNRWHRLVVNAATADRDLAWINDMAMAYGIEAKPRRDLAIIAVQGPNAREKALPLLPEALRPKAEALSPFFATSEEEWFVGRTGYTGEDGFEIILPADQASHFWQGLADAGVTPCGLGARDTLRLEAGMTLYGTDMDENSSPLESGLGWTIAWDPPERDFCGRWALELQRREGGQRRFVGLLLEGKGVLRNHQKVFADDAEIGEITSGGFAPTLGRSIALARVDKEIGETCSVEIRGKQVAARVVKPPFVRKGKICIDL